MALTSFTREQESEWLRTKGPLTHEMCEFRLKEIDAEEERLKEAMALSQAIVDAKTKGLVRLHQRNIKSLKEEIKSLEYKRTPYYNGGIL